MKNKVLFIAIVLMAFVANVTFAQDAKMVKHTKMEKMDKKMTSATTIKLEQSKGDFNIQGLTLSAGTYVFEIANNGVDHEVGFVIAPKSNPDQHIKSGYVQKTIKDGETSNSSEVTLAKGEYIYFCPLNPTPQYTITVN